MIQNYKNTKQYVLMLNIICRYHPDFSTDKALRAYGLKDPFAFNIEHLVEQALAHIGDYELMEDDAHADFSDLSDCKTASIGVNPHSLKAPNSFQGKITNVARPGGNYKAGALRCVIYNPHKNDLRFYFLPKDAWQPLTHFDCVSKIGRLNYVYHKQKDIISRLEDFRIDNFKKLALCS